MWDLERSSENYDLRNISVDVKICDTRREFCHLRRNQRVFLFVSQFGLIKSVSFSSSGISSCCLKKEGLCYVNLEL